MAGVDLKAIHEALADQLEANLASDWNTAAFPFSGMEHPLVEVWPRVGNTGYIGYFVTYGANGKATIQLELRVFIANNTPEDAAERIWEALSVGTGHGDSIVDAVMQDRTLGGTVADTIVREAVWSATTDDLGSVAILPVDIVLAKQGANV